MSMPTRFLKPPSERGSCASTMGIEHGGVYALVTNRVRILTSFYPSRQAQKGQLKALKEPIRAWRTLTSLFGANRKVCSDNSGRVVTLRIRQFRTPGPPHPAHSPTRPPGWLGRGASETHPACDPPRSGRERASSRPFYARDVSSQKGRGHPACVTAQNGVVSPPVGVYHVYPDHQHTHTTRKAPTPVSPGYHPLPLQGQSHRYHCRPACVAPSHRCREVIRGSVG